jgi:hypothetical protein
MIQTARKTKPKKPEKSSLECACMAEKNAAMAEGVWTSSTIATRNHNHLNFLIQGGPSNFFTNNAIPG